MDGFIYIYDLSISVSIPVASLDLQAQSSDSKSSSDTNRNINRKSNKRAGISCIAFNHRQRDLLASCCIDGVINIWKLNYNLSIRNNARELSVLDKLIQIDR